MRINIDLTQGKPKNIFFTSDLHISHANILKFDNRPFNSVEEMNSAIEDGWNQVVAPEDTVIYLGDLSFAKSSEKQEVSDLLKRLNGGIHYVLGNHDKYEDIKGFGRFQTIQDYLEVKITHEKDGNRQENLFCCFHYPIYSWNKAHHGAYMIHGHTHGNLHHGEDASFYDNRRVIDVGCMLHDYKPITHYQVIDKLSHVEYQKLTRTE